jgi:hypothetical protein
MVRYVPKKLRTTELCLVAAKQCSRALKYLWREQTAELCYAAVSEHGLALDWVNEEFKTAELCLAAVMQNGKALQYVPEELKANVEEAALKLKAVKRRP